MAMECNCTTGARPRALAMPSLAEERLDGLLADGREDVYVWRLRNKRRTRYYVP